MLTQFEILQYLKENNEFFRNQLGIRKIGLFGSFARNQQTEESDIDILIDMQDGVRDIFGKRLFLQQFLQNHFNRSVDVCHEKGLKPLFRQSILSEVMYA